MADRYGGAAAADRLLVDNHDPAINGLKVIQETTTGTVSAAHIEASNMTSGSKALTVRGGADLISARTLADTEVFKVDQAGKVTSAGVIIGGNAAPVSFTPADPTATASQSLVMMGLGTTCTYTPAGSGLVLVIVSGGASTNTSIVTGQFGGRFGTGTAPNNGDAVSGTRFGSAAEIQFKSGGAPVTVQTFALTAVLALTPATAYWFDIALLTSVAADTAILKGVSMAFAELP
jgi:hypothetical protein